MLNVDHRTGPAPGGAAREREVTFLAGKLLGRLSVPLIVIPGRFTDEEIIALT